MPRWAGRITAVTLDQAMQAQRGDPGEMWQAVIDDGPVPVRAPRARPIPNRPAPASGEDTAAVSADLGLPTP